MPGSRDCRVLAAGGIVLTAAILVGVFLVMRRPSDSDYFGPNEPTWVRVPTTVGDPVYVGILILRAHAGDTIELESIAFAGVLGDTVLEPLVRHIDEPAEILGAIAESDLGGTIDLATYGPLPGLRFAEADGSVELAVRITGTTPVHGFDGLWLRFTIDGADGSVEDWIPMRASVCTGTTRAEAVDRCRPIETEMHSFGL